MSRFYQRPDNALKKANEFIEVGKPTRALDTLYDVIRGKKHRAFSEKVIEPIMIKYLELCVELKKPHTAKEGLYQYRLMCQSVNVGLLEKVIRTYIKMAEDRTEGARESLKKKSELMEEQAQEAVVEVDDLDNLSMAEMTLLNAITEEQAQKRSDRAALIPWVKFLWESYTQCLDLLRNNARLEKLYHDIAQMAFKFCLSYYRKTEFRKLCERLRKHFDDILQRVSQQINNIDFSSPETHQFNMETRLAQLDSAIQLELWQEAYKAIEDIHSLMNQSRKSQTRMMAYYYQKLSLVFWKAGNFLFHAATLLKYYILYKEMKKNVSYEDMQKNASQVVMATLAITFPVLHPEFERFVETDKGMLEKSQKLATLLFLPQPPTRASMIKDINRYGVLNNAIHHLQELYVVLEQDFDPLMLCVKVNGLLGKIKDTEGSDHLHQYIEPMQNVAIVRLIKQISQVYQTIDYEHFLDLAVFSNKFHLEQLLVDAVRYHDMQITIDHRSNSVKFGASLSESSREDLPEGPHLQDMPSEGVRLQLVNFFDSLQETINMINPPYRSGEEDEIRVKIISHYILTEKQIHSMLMSRQKMIADRRVELERTQVDKEQEEKLRNEQIMKQQMILEQKRLESEQKEREKKRIELEKKEIQQRRVKERMAQISSTPFGKKVVQKLEEEDLSKLDMETVMQKQQEEMAREAKEHMDRLRAQEKRFDHLERAKRLGEIPIIKEYVREKKEKEKKEWEAHEQDRIAHLIEERKIAVANRDRMKRMKEDKELFLKTLLESRRHVFEAKLTEFERRLKQEKDRRLIERKQQRKEERRKKFLEDKAELEKQREEARRQEEEKKREEIKKMTEERENLQKDKYGSKIKEEDKVVEKIAEPWKPSFIKRAQAAGEPATPPSSSVWHPEAVKKSRARGLESDDSRSRDYDRDEYLKEERYRMVSREEKHREGLKEDRIRDGIKDDRYREFGRWRDAPRGPVDRFDNPERRNREIDGSESDPRDSWRSRDGTRDERSDRNYDERNKRDRDYGDADLDKKRSGSRLPYPRGTAPSNEDSWRARDHIRDSNSTSGRSGYVLSRRDDRERGFENRDSNWRNANK